MSVFQLCDLLQLFYVCFDIYLLVELLILCRVSELFVCLLKCQIFNGFDFVSDYFWCKLVGMEFEVFGVIYFDLQFQFIVDDVLF